MAPEVPHVVAVKVLSCCFFPFVPCFLSHTDGDIQFYPPPAESDGVGEFSSEDEEDIQVSPIDSY